MIRLIVSLMLFISSHVMGQNSEDTQQLSAEVVNLRNDNGSVGFALYDEDSFMKKPIQAQYIAIQEGKASVIFDNLKPGIYAVLVFHDENSNGRMDFEENGMPKEDYGMSNNDMSFGPPTFEQAKFNFTGESLKLEIKL